MRLKVPQPLLILPFTLLCAYAIIVYAAPKHFIDSIKYLAYLIFAIYLPGLFLFQKYSEKKPSILETFAIAIPLGFCLEFCFSFLVTIFKWREAAIVLPLAGFAYLLILLIKNKNKELFLTTDAKELYIFGFCTIAAIYTIAHRGFVYTTLHEFAANERHNIDYLYHLGSIAEMRNHWPFHDPRQVGYPYNYHFFEWMHILAAHFCTRISLDVLLYRLAIYPFTLALVAQIFLLGGILSRNLLGAVLAVVLCLFMEEFSFNQKIFGNEFINYLYTSPTFLPSLMFLGLLMLMLPSLLESKARLRMKDCCLSTLIFFTAFSSKGTIGPPIIASLGLTFLIESLKKKSLHKKALLVLGLSISVFLFLFFFIYGNPGSASARFDFFPHFKWTPFYLENIKIFGLNANLALIFLVYLIGFYGIRLFALNTFILRTEESNKPSTHELFIGALSLCFFILGNFIVMNFHAEFYFLFPIQLPLSILAAKSLSRMMEAPNSIRKWALVAIATFLGIVQIRQWWLLNQKYHQAYLSREINLENDPKTTGFFEALRWIKANTSSNDVIISNLFTKTNADHPENFDFKLSVYFNYSGFAERRMFQEGWAYWVPQDEANRRLLMADQLFNENHVQLLDQLKTQYHVSLIFIDKRWPSKFLPAPNMAQKIYSTASVDIYRLAEN